MPEKSGMEAALCTSLPTGPTTGDGVCPEEGVAAAAANVTNRRKARRDKFMSTSGSDLPVAQVIRTRVDFRIRIVPSVGTNAALPARFPETSARPGGSSPVTLHYFAEHWEDHRINLVHNFTSRISDGGS